ncbi:hypothetical protein BDV98DRAFT_472729, partial [Pterulicium gracile]
VSPPYPAVFTALAIAGNLCVFLALNEHLILSATSSIRVWKRYLACLLIADLGHLAAMV